jgi:hypothetical protein
MKHTFNREQIKRIILEEIQADLLFENTNKQILEEGMLDTIKSLKNKFFPNKSDEEIEKEIAQVAQNPEALNSMPSRRRIGILFLAGMIGGMLAQASFDYKELSDAAAQDAQKVRASLQQSAEKSQDVQNFMQIAAAEAEGGTATTPEEVEAKIKEIVRTYGDSIDVAPIAPGRGIFIDGDPRKGKMRGFAYVPASQIADDEVMPFMGISKKDYETLLRATFLSSPGGDERLEKLVTGQGTKGGAGFWAYDNNKLFQGYTEGSDFAMLPLEWSVANELVQKRKSKGRL